MSHGFPVLKSPIDNVIPLYYSLCLKRPPFARTQVNKPLTYWKISDVLVEAVPLCDKIVFESIDVANI